ncbi:MAG: hypothetical protein R3305_04615 [Gammaproteobacteria bacterium]|nr:hypothetical protein [Gammaproteobacteria bacterium]
MKRRVMHRTFAALVAAQVVLVAAASRPAAAQSLPPGTEDCVAALDAVEFSGDFDDGDIPALGEICPDYWEALAQPPWSDLLPPNEA